MSDNQTSSCIIIAIAGASASGKSSIASTVHKELCNELGCEEIGIIAEDSYYKDQSHLEMSERVKTNYDHPNSMDRDLLIQHLKSLKAGKAVEIPVYSYVDHTRTNDVTYFTPKRIVILEGILLLTDERVRQLTDISVFVDTPLDICFIRRYSVIWKSADVPFNRSLINIAPLCAQCSYSLSSLLNSTPIL